MLVIAIICVRSHSEVLYLALPPMKDVRVVLMSIALSMSDWPTGTTVERMAPEL
ncbi:MAG: hypothetical protein E5Y89_12710 [Mesorhizobium sp.]|nr:MAG: hypothetical protein E5Y89_12710 [Mesorhizobium sp.]